MMGELWWNKLVNSVRFLDDIKFALLEGNSVVLNFSSEIPWKEIMLETLEQKLMEMTDNRAFDIVDGSKVKNIGKYLLEHYCEKKEQERYWPVVNGVPEPPERFLALSKETRMNHTYICVDGIISANAEEWTSSMSEYLKNCDDSQEHGMFILLTQGKCTFSSSKTAERFNYEDYVSDYDCMMLCLTLISSEKCTRAEKMYICEVASNIADNQVELAGLLARKADELIKKPIRTAKTVFEDYDIEISNLEEHVNMAVWKAQIKSVFPAIENFRAEMIRKYENKLKKFLPITISNNEYVTKPSDLEIGQLWYICKDNWSTKIIEQSDYDILKKMKDARNTLAHWEILSYQQLKEIHLL